MKSKKIGPRVILITGATGSIGQALARAYAQPNVTLILHGRKVNTLKALALECERLGAQVIHASFDVRDIAKLREWAMQCDAQYHIELLIANAGMNINTGVRREGEQWEEIDALLDINVRATIALVNAVLPGMRKRRQGQIALVSSLAAYFGLPITPSYCASKAAIKAYGEGLRGGLAPESIKVNVVMPGYVSSPMCDAMPGPKPFLWTAEKAAKKIKVGLARNQARISFPFPLNLSTWLMAVIHPQVAQKLVQLFGFK